jgi:hypothetical protein
MEALFGVMINSGFEILEIAPRSAVRTPHCGV